MGGFWLQGSNDGENWVNMIIMRQGGHGNDYHIFTPQTVTDQRYIDAGHSKSTDESLHWVSKGGSYRIYRAVENCIGELELYGNPAPATELTPEITSTLNIATPYYYPNNIHVRSETVPVSVDGSLVGTIIAGSGVWNKALYERAFDNNGRTHYDPCIEGPENWVGLMFDEPNALTEVRILPKRGAYTDFRYVCVSDTQSSLAELLVFGAPAEAAAPFTTVPLIATHNTFDGEIFYASAKNTVVDTEISGTPICGTYYYGWRDRNRGTEAAFDGDLETNFFTIPRMYDSHYWVGLKADAATAVQKVRIYNPVSNNKELYFQGSLDGVNWIDLAVFNSSIDTRDADGWFTLYVSDTAFYDYFRILNDSAAHPYCELEVSEFKIYGTEATASETTTPETNVPETIALETDEPETQTPADDSDTPNAPQTFDSGVITAVAAVISAAGWAIAKKKK